MDKIFLKSFRRHRTGDLIDKITSLELKLDEAVRALERIVNPGESSVPQGMNHFEWNIKLVQDVLSKIR